LETAGLVLTTDKEEMFPGREMSRIFLRDIIAVVRNVGETGSDRPPRWTEGIDNIGGELEDAVSGVIGDRALSDLLDDLPES
jgi:hypothetical protein